MATPVPVSTCTPTKQEKATRAAPQRENATVTVTAQTDNQQKKTKEQDAPKCQPTAVTATPPWSTLTRDYFQSITKFLDLVDFVRCSRVCAGWLHESTRVGARHDSFRLELPSPCDDPMWHRMSMSFKSLLDSSLARHVTHLYLIGMSVNESTMQRISKGVTRMAHIKCDIEIQAEGKADETHCDEPNETDTGVNAGRVTVGRSASAPFPFPLTLTSIDLTVTASTDDDDDGGLTIDPRSYKLSALRLHSLCALPSLTDIALAIEIDNTDHIDDHRYRIVESLLPFRERMISLTLEWSRFGMLHANDILLLRQFTRLTSFDLGTLKWFRADLNSLFAAPFPFAHLRRFGLGETYIGDEIGESLARATQLTHFHTTHLSMRNPAFIGAYTQLESCILACSTTGPDVDAGLLVTALSHCTRIHDLYLDHPSMTADQLESLLTHLTRLGSLMLTKMPGLTSLSFLSRSRVLHLSSSLTHLILKWCDRILPGEVEAGHLHPLRALTHFTLTQSLSDRLAPTTIAMMTPGSPQFRADLWPSLTHFKYDPYINRRGGPGTDA